MEVPVEKALEKKSEFAQKALSALRQAGKYTGYVAGAVVGPAAVVVGIKLGQRLASKFLGQ